MIITERLSHYVCVPLPNPPSLPTGTGIKFIRQRTEIINQINRRKDMIRNIQFETRNLERQGYKVNLIMKPDCIEYDYTYFLSDSVI